MTIRPERSLSDNAGCEPHNANEDSPIDTLLSGEYVSALRYGHEDSPHEATEFSGDGSDGHVPMFAPIKPEKLVDQTKLRLHRNGDDLRWLSLTSPFKNQCSSSVVPVVPGSLDQEAAHMDIAGLVMEPRYSRFPEECSEGTRPK